MTSRACHTHLKNCASVFLTTEYTGYLHVLRHRLRLTYGYIALWLIYSRIFAEQGLVSVSAF